MNVVVVGESALASELVQLTVQAGHNTLSRGEFDFTEKLQRDQLQPELADCDVAIELQNQSVDAKQRQLSVLAQMLPEETLILSLTLATGVSEAASWIANPQRLVGFGLLPPVETPGMVEIAAGLQTAASFMDRASDYWQLLDLEPVVVGEGPGLVRARTVCCLINEAASALMENVASAEDIDAAMQLGTNYPHGPLEWADLIGLDNVYAVMSGLHREWGEDRYRPSPVLKRMIHAGQLGRHSGRGFFAYGPDGGRVDRQ